MQFSAIKIAISSALVSFAHLLNSLEMIGVHALLAGHS
jgi:hypothetical protein